MKEALYWAPRILGLLFVAFLSIFSLDVFDEYSGLQVVFALFMHLIPSLVLLFAIGFAWKYELVGAVMFIGAALIYIYFLGFNGPESWYLIISGPAFVVGLLFFLSWIQKRRYKN